MPPAEIALRNNIESKSDREISHVADIDIANLLAIKRPYFDGAQTGAD